MSWHGAVVYTARSTSFQLSTSKTTSTLYTLNIVTGFAADIGIYIFIHQNGSIKRKKDKKYINTKIK